MLDSFPAAPGTFLIIAGPGSKDYTTIPVVGWGIAKNGRAEPITPVAAQPITHGMAYLIPIPDSGEMTIFDPVYNKKANTLEDWLAFVSKKSAKVRAAEKSGEIPVASLGVAFGDKTFVKTSFWIFRDGTHEFIFEVDGGEPLPEDTRVTKTNRNDYTLLKKTAKVVSVAELMAETEGMGDSEDPDAANEGVDGLDEEAEDLI